jgi:hypothetical protein
MLARWSGRERGEWVWEGVFRHELRYQLEMLVLQNDGEGEEVHA